MLWTSELFWVKTDNIFVFSGTQKTKVTDENVKKHNLKIPIVDHWTVLGKNGFYIRIQQSKKHKYSLENFMYTVKKSDCETEVEVYTISK